MSVAQDKIEKAKALVQANKVAEAEAQLRQAMALDRRSATARVELARILGATGRGEEALKLVDEGLQLEANNADALAIKGLILAQGGKYQEAIPYYRRALQQNSQLAMAYFNLGAALREVGELVESESTIRQGLAVEPRNFHGHYELAQSLAYQLKVKDSILEILETLKINPFFVRGYLALARLYQQGNHPEEAIKILQNCLKNNPQAWEATEMLKDSYLLKGDFHAARQCWQEVVEKRGNVSDFVQLGNIALAAGEFEKAEEAFKRGLAIDVKSWQPHYALAELYDVAELMEEAKGEYLLAVEYAGDAYEPYNGFGLFLLNQGDLPEGIKHLMEACRLAPAEEATPVYNLALGLVQADQLEEAKELLQTSLTGDPVGELYDEMRRLLAAIVRQLEP